MKLNGKKTQRIRDNFEYDINFFKNIKKDVFNCEFY